MKIYAGFTSWPKRIDTAHETAESILDQSMPVDGVELNLYAGDFPNGYQDLPESLKRLKEENPKFSIYFHGRDLKVWLKSVPTIRRHAGEDYVL